MSLPATITSSHKEILDAADALCAAVRRGPTPPDFVPLRMRLANVVREKLPMQQALLAQLDPEKRGMIPEFDRVTNDDRALRLAYSQHISQWNGEAIERDFAGYAASVEEMVARLTRHIRILETELYGPAFSLFDISI